MISDEFDFNENQASGSGNFLFHSTLAIIADAASQQFHMKTELRRSSPMNYDSMKTRLEKFFFHFKVIYPGYNSVYILFYNWPCKIYLQNKKLYD